MSSSKTIRQSRDYWDSLSNHDTASSVLDPNDTLGYKNHYIRSLITNALEEALSDLPAKSRVLDFGCGTGQNFPLLNKLMLRPIGVDISFPLLHQALEQFNGYGVSCIQYDGRSIPLQDNSVSAILTFSVLIYIVSEKDIDKSLSELYRVLKPGGRLVAIEQTTITKKSSPDGIKLQRSKGDFLRLFLKPGFRCTDAITIRYGHFPFLYLVRYGVLPQKLFPLLIKLERWFGKIRPVPKFDYTDTMFILEKQ